MIRSLAIIIRATRRVQLTVNIHVVNFGCEPKDESEASSTGVVFLWMWEIYSSLCTFI
jgi:hypothetical protein